MGGRVEENEAVRMRCCKLGVGGWVEENETVGMSYCELGVGGWVGGWVGLLPFVYRQA